MSVYVDSSLLLKTYLPEKRSAEAIRLLSAYEQLPFTPLHEVEVYNSINQWLARKEMNTGQHRAVLDNIGEDMKAGRLLRVPVDMERTFALGVRLSFEYGTRRLIRSLDLLHTAFALELGSEEFVTSDKKQAAFARVLKFKVAYLEP